MAGTLVLDTLQNGAGTASTSADNVIRGCAKAFVNFNGQSTPTIRQSFNVSSITDNGTGDYTINFTTAMPNTTYSVAGSCGEPNSTLGALTSRSDGYLTTSNRVQCNFANGNMFDPTVVNVVIFSL